jgi:hypothetical protein
MVATGCTSTASPSVLGALPTTAPPSIAVTPALTPAPPPTAADLEGAEGDLDLLLQLLEAIHPEPFHGVTRSDWLARLEEVRTALPDVTPEATMVAVMELVALLSREGRDGHQIAFPPEGGPMLPIRVFEFSDGVFVTNALDPDLVGARILSVAERPIDEVLAALEPLVPRDSPATVPAFRPFFLLRADVLEGMGLLEDDASVALRVEVDGTERDVELATIPFDEFANWAGPFGLLHLPQRDGLRFTLDEPQFRVERLDDGVVYARLDEVRAVPTSELAELRDAVADPDVSRVIFDLRHNPGGDNTTYPLLLETIRDIEQPLWVLTDRITFSAASNLATEIEQTTDARFAGEAMGGGLNFWDDVQFVELVNLPIPLSVGISTRYWQKSFADDPRLTIEPELAVPHRSEDYFGGVDATLDAVLSAP